MLNEILEILLRKSIFLGVILLKDRVIVRRRDRRKKAVYPLVLSAKVAATKGRGREETRG